MDDIPEQKRQTRLLPVLAAFLGALAPDVPERSHGVPPGYQCAACGATAYTPHAATCSPPRGLRKAD